MDTWEDHEQRVDDIPANHHELNTTPPRNQELLTTSFSTPSSSGIRLMQDRNTETVTEIVGQSATISPENTPSANQRNHSAHHSPRVDQRGISVHGNPEIKQRNISGFDYFSPRSSQRILSGHHTSSPRGSRGDVFVTGNYMGRERDISNDEGPRSNLRDLLVSGCEHLVTDPRDTADYDSFRLNQRDFSMNCDLNVPQDNSIGRSREWIGPDEIPGCRPTELGHGTPRPSQTQTPWGRPGPSVSRNDFYRDPPVMRTFPVQDDQAYKGKIREGENLNGTEPKDKGKEKKEKKSITTKTFAHGMMDVSLLTSNATQLRSVLSNEDHQFYNMLLWCIGFSISLQILSGVLMIMSDYYKTQDSVKDRQLQRRRKILNFISLAMISVITSLNIIISAFYTSDSSTAVGRVRDAKPVFATADYHFSHNHTEL